MMSPRQWAVLLSFYIFYLLAGALVFQSLEQGHEKKNLNELVTLQGTLSYVIQHVKETKTKNELIEAIKNFERHLDAEMFLPKNYKRLIHLHIDSLDGKEQHIVNNKTLLFYSLDGISNETNGDNYSNTTKTNPNEIQTTSKNDNISQNLSLNEQGMGIMSDVLEHEEIEETWFEKNSMWTMWNSFYFSFTAITTIGFGHMYPSTAGGQFFCILYSILGVPLNGILFSGLEGIYSSKMMGALDKGIFDSKRKIVLYATLYLIPGMLIFMVFPAGVFMLMEGWSFLEGFYFAFITITTIGFGDYVAGYNGNYTGDYIMIYRIGIYIWIVFGLGYFLMMANFVQKLLRSNDVRQVDRKMRNLIHQKTADIEKDAKEKSKSLGSCAPMIDEKDNIQVKNNIKEERPEDLEKSEDISENRTDHGECNRAFQNLENGRDGNHNLESEPKIKDAELQIGEIQDNVSVSPQLDTSQSNNSTEELTLSRSSSESTYDNCRL